MRALTLLVAVVVGTGIVFHPARPLYMRQHPVLITADDGATAGR